jgi:hypothetical protein
MICLPRPNSLSEDVLLELGVAPAGMRYRIGIFVRPLALRRKVISSTSIKKLLILMFCLAAASSCAVSGCDGLGKCYVRAAAAGTANGSDWSNAYPALPAGLVRGVTYYIAAGSYPAYTFKTPDSGTTTITIKSATITDHGTSTGWSATYAGQAVFSASSGIGLRFLSDYWILDGNGTYSGAGCGTGGSGCSIKIDGTSCSASECDDLGICVAAYLGLPSCPTNITVKYVEIAGRGDSGTNTHRDNNVHDDSNGGTSSNGGGNTFTFQHLYIHDSSGVPFFTERANNITIDHCWVVKNRSTSVNHAEALADANSGNFTISNSVWQDIEGSGYLVELSRSESGNAPNWSIYGNIFMYQSGNPNARTGVGDGVIACINGKVCSNWLIYNNTFLDINWGLTSRVCLNCTAEGGTGSSATVYNNLWWSNSMPADNAVACSGCTLTQDYNSYLSTTPPRARGKHDLVDTSSPLPFVGWSASPPDFHLAREKADWTGGTVLPSPYNIDPDWVTRGSDGTWERGAFEFSLSGR